MYTIHADGELLFSTASEDEKTIVLEPKLSLDVNAAGSLSFVLPPCNGMHGSLQKLKTIITVEQDGEQIFRGRVVDVERDFYKQETVYCEGDKSFLLDSVQAPYSYTGSVQGFFQQLVTNHNNMVEEKQRFTVGNITAVSSSENMEVENDAYSGTSNEITEKLVEVYGGYLKTRTVGGTTYLDWVDKYNSGANSQPIQFAVNLLDLKDKVSAEDVFTVLIPLGASEIDDDGNYTDPLTIESVNNGAKYLQDDAAVALYGKIWRAKTWAYEDDPSALKQKGLQYLQTGVALQTLTLKAVDMHFVDGTVQAIRIGDNVLISSEPHGLNQTTICSKLDIDLLNPENTGYTFGEAPRTLTENIVKTEKGVDTLTGGWRYGGGGKKKVQDELSDIIRWAKINVDEANAYIQLTAGELDKTNQRLSAAEIEIDGVNAEITLAASRMDSLEGRTNSAEIAIDGANAEIELKVDKNGVISSINQTAESIKIKASKINLDGYVTASELSALKAELANVTSGTLQASLLYTQNLTATGVVRLAGHTCEWYELDVVTKVTISKTTAGSVQRADGVYITPITGVSLSVSKETINYLGT